MKKVITGLLATVMCLSLYPNRSLAEDTAQVQPSDTQSIQTLEATPDAPTEIPEAEESVLEPEMIPEAEESVLEPEMIPDADDPVEGAEAMLANPLYPRFKDLLGFDPAEKNLEYAFSDSDCVSAVFADHQLIVPEYTLELGDGSRLYLPMTYQELLDAGWYPNEELYADSLSGNEYQWYNFINADGKTINAELANYSASPIDLKDAVVTQLQAGGELTETYSLCGIQAGATVQDIVDQFGLPYQTSYYCWEDNTEHFDLYYIDDINYSDILFNMDPETGLLSSICYCKLLHPDDRPA